MGEGVSLSLLRNGFPVANLLVVSAPSLREHGFYGGINLPVSPFSGEYFRSANGAVSFVLYTREHVSLVGSGPFSRVFILADVSYLLGVRVIFGDGEHYPEGSNDYSHADPLESIAVVGFSVVGGRSVSSSPGHGLVGKSYPPFRTVLGAPVAESGFVGFSIHVLSKYWDLFFRKLDLTGSEYCTSDPFGRLDEGVKAGRILGPFKNTMDLANAAFGEAGDLIESVSMPGICGISARTDPRGVGMVNDGKADRWLGFNIGDKAPAPGISRSTPTMASGVVMMPTTTNGESRLTTTGPEIFSSDPIESGNGDRPTDSHGIVKDDKKSTGSSVVRGSKDENAEVSSNDAPNADSRGFSSNLQGFCLNGAFIARACRISLRALDPSPEGGKALPTMETGEIQSHEAVAVARGFGKWV